MEFPVKFSARARKEKYRVDFVEILTVPDEILRGVYAKHNETQMRKVLGRYGKWRIDYPINKNKKMPNGLKILLKIILRGRATRLSPQLEEKIRKITGGVKCDGIDVLELRDVYDSGYAGGAKTQWCDGAGRAELGNRSAEQYLYEEILVPTVEEFGAKNVKDIVPQVVFASLTGEEDDTRRVDFLITHGEKQLAIEVDDATHDREELRDESRDAVLKNAGVEVCRIKDMDLLNDERIEKLRQKIRTLYKKYENGEVRNREFLLGVKLAGMMQAVIIKLAENGINFQKSTSIDFHESVCCGLTREMGRKIAEVVVEDLKELDENIAEIYGEEKILSGLKVGEGGILVSENWQETDGTEVLVQEVSVPGELINMTCAGGEFLRRGVKEKNLKYILKYLFGYDEFRENQMDAIKRGISGEDSIVLLPTGSGKSLIYQYLAMILTGTVIVVEPLRALIEDQVENLRLTGIDIVAGMSSDLKRQEKRAVSELIRCGAYGIVYVTPERMQMEDFRALIHEAKENGGGFPICALDEAHCVSEWGHDFRVAYLNLAESARKMMKRGNKKPVVVALTGTASDSVLKDMERDLRIAEDGVIRPRTFDRAEIHYRVMNVPADEKMMKLIGMLDKEIPEDFGEKDRLGLMQNRGEETKAGVVFCVYKTWRTDFGVDAVYMKMRRAGWAEVTKYYGTEVETGKMRENARRFKQNEASLMVATKAFGMGIDKPNIRYTVHYGIPNSIEAFYQEAGRAGRDGKKAMSYVLLSDNAPERNVELIRDVAVEDLRKELKKVGKKNRDDVNRLLYLHQGNYDRNDAMMALESVLRQLGAFEAGEKHITAQNKEECQKWQKILFWLKVLEIIDDYTMMDYANNEYRVTMSEFGPERIVRAYGKYVGQYQAGQAKTEMVKLKSGKYDGKREFVIAAVNTLMDFAENVFERSRRRAIFNVLQLMSEAAKIEDKDEQDRVVRRKILSHLGNTQVDVLSRVMEDKDVIVEAATVVTQIMRRDEEKLLAETRRMLQAYPEHPGLLMIAGILGSIDEETDAETAVNDLKMAIENAEKYKLKTEVCKMTIAEVMGETCRRSKSEEKYKKFVEMMTRDVDEDFDEKILEVIPKEWTMAVATRVLSRYNLVMVSEIGSKIETGLWTKKS